MSYSGSIRESRPYLTISVLLLVLNTLKLQSAKLYVPKDLLHPFSFFLFLDEPALL